MCVVLATLRERTEAKPEAIGALYGQDWLAAPDGALERALYDLLDRDAVIVPDSDPAAGPPGPVGLGEARRLFDAARDDWASCRYLVERIDELDGDVLVSGRVLAETRASAARAWFSFAHLWRIEAGRVVEIVAHHDLGEARRALKHADRP